MDNSHALLLCNLHTVSGIKPVTDEQVFYDKFSYDKFYLPSACVYMQHILYDKFSYDKFYLPSARVYTQHILYDKFSYDKFYFSGVNVSTSLL